VQASIDELELAEIEFTGQARQVDEILDPTVNEYVPTLQPIHSALPLMVLYLPGTHAKHSPLSTPVYPGIHLHSEGENCTVFEGHAKHTSDVLAPTVTE
jgi:hypothetical protein